MRYADKEAGSRRCFSAIVGEAEVKYLTSSHIVASFFTSATASSRRLPLLPASSLRTYNAADPRIYILPCQNVFGIPYSKCTILTDTSLFSPATLAESFTVGGRCCCIGILCFPGDSRVIYTKSQPSKKKQVLRTFESTHGSSFHAPMDVRVGATARGTPKRDAPYTPSCFDIL